jgi:S-adenosyl methyltransferase
VDRPKFDTKVAHPARIWDYWLGGKETAPLSSLIDRDSGQSQVQWAAD